MGRAKR